MFTTRSISVAIKETLKVLVIFAVVSAWRAPAIFQDLVRPFGRYVSNLYSDATHQKSGNSVAKPVSYTLPLRPGRQTDLPMAINLHPATPAGLSTSPNEEESESSGKSDASAVQDRPRDHLRFALKLNQEAFRNRFHAGIVVPTGSAKPSADVRTGLTWNECEEAMHQLTELHQAGKWSDGLTKSEEFLRALDNTPSAYPEYRILTAGLAFQMSAMAGTAEKTKHFGELAMRLSRQFENYQLEEIEGSYYQVTGYKFNFPELLAATQSLSNDFASLAPEKAVKRAEALVAACGSLPDTSIFRLKSDFFEALAKQAWENDPFNDLRRFGSIQSRAESVGNHVIKNACETVVTALFQQIQGVTRTISEEIKVK